MAQCGPCFVGCIPDVPAKLLFKISKNLHFPIGVVTNSEGMIIVTDTGNNTLKMYKPDGTGVVEFGANVSWFKGFGWIALATPSIDWLRQSVLPSIFWLSFLFMWNLSNKKGYKLKHCLNNKFYRFLLWLWPWYCWFFKVKLRQSGLTVFSGFLLFHNVTLMGKQVLRTYSSHSQYLLPWCHSRAHCVDFDRHEIQSGCSWDLNPQPLDPSHCHHTRVNYL